VSDWQPGTAEDGDIVTDPLYGRQYRFTAGFGWVALPTQYEIRRNEAAKIRNLRKLLIGLAFTTAVAGLIIYGGGV
jgi:hypothetical protein